MLLATSPRHTLACHGLSAPNQLQLCPLFPLPPLCSSWTSCATLPQGSSETSSRWECVCNSKRVWKAVPARLPTRCSSCPAAASSSRKKGPLPSPYTAILLRHCPSMTKHTTMQTFCAGRGAGPRDCA